MEPIPRLCSKEACDRYRLIFLLTGDDSRSTEAAMEQIVHLEALTEADLS